MTHFTRVSDEAFEGRPGRVERLDNGVIFHSSIPDMDITGDHMKEILACIHALSPYESAAILIERTGDYTLTFGAQQAIRRDEQLAAVAFWMRKPQASRSIVQFVGETYLSHVPTEGFAEKEDALRWLEGLLPGENPG